MQNQAPIKIHGMQFLCDLPIEAEYLRECIGMNHTDEERSDGYEYLDHLKKFVTAWRNKSDWSFANMLAEKIAIIERILHDDCT
jgi:hypothetical protein